MLSILLLCGLWCLGVVYVRYARAREAKLPPLPPQYPGALPLIGIAHKFKGNGHDIHTLVKAMSGFNIQEGGVTCGRFGPEIYYAVGDPDDAILVANTCTTKHFMYSYVKNFMGNGLLLISGALHKHHRKYMNPAFSLPVLQSFIPIFNSVYKELIKEMDQFCGKGPIDYLDMFRRHTLKIGCLTTFGNENNDTNFLQKYIETADEILGIVMLRLFKIYYNIDIIYKLSGLQKKEKRLCDDLKKLAFDMLYEKRANMKDGLCINSAQTPYKPVIDILLETTQDGGLSDMDIIDELNTTISAAYETTSQHLQFLAVHVGTYPDVQERMYKEIIEVCGKDGEITKEHLSQLVYTEAVIKESLRMIPPGSLIFRSVDQDVKLKNYTMRAGSNVVILTYAMHYHPLWGPDVSQFNPDRWLNKDLLPLYSKLSAPFSIGKRGCIGKTYAMMSMKIGIAYLVRNFRMRADVSKLVLIVDPLTRSEGGHEISLERRN